MFIIKRLFCIVIMLTLFIGCKKKKASLSGDEKVEVTDFMEAFDPFTLPYRLTDTLVNKKDEDTSSISHKVFTQFVPDSIFSKVFGKGVKVKMYPVGKISVEKKEVYLVAKVAQGTKKASYILCFDKDNKFTGAMPLLIPDQYVSTQQFATIDKNFTITKSILRKNADGSISEGKDAYVFNSETKTFMLIMTDALDEKPAEITNPIDTLPRKNKFSADYVKSKTDYISIRDAHKPGKVVFFVHFEKNNGECTGELKGEAAFTSANTAVYRAGGDPCVLQFTFSTSAVTMKEVEGCGSRRGLRCLFEGSYPRKKEIKPKQTKKKTTIKK
ncbi:MAG: hypothetical protein ABUT20_03630 [Bacteroidota bacterium]